MIETRRLENVVIFLQKILCFVVSRKIIKICNDVAQKHGNVTVKDFQKYEKLRYKQNKRKLDIDFLNNCKHLGVYLKFLFFKLLNVSNRDALSIGKRLLHTPSINAVKYFNMSQKNSVNRKPFYPNNYLLLTSTSLSDL